MMRLISVLVFCIFTASASANPAFDTWADAFAADWVRLAPESATRSQYFAGAEQDTVDRLLTPWTPARRQRVIALAREGREQLDLWLAGPLDPAQRISAAIIRRELDNTLAGERFQDHGFVFNQLRGAHVQPVLFLTEIHPLRNTADVASYLARLDQVATRQDEGIARARAAAARDLIPPRFIVERARGQVAAFLEPVPENNVLVIGLARRTESLADLSPEARAKAIAEATRIVAERIRPAYVRVQTFLTELLPRTTDAAGLSRLPDGADAYAHALARYTTTALTAQEIHAIGLREVTRIEADMDRLLRHVGLVDGSVRERMQSMRQAKQLAAEPDPRPALLARYTEIVRDAEQRSEALFNLKPRARVEVRRVPPLTEATASASYSSPAPDGTRPGIFWVPLRGPVFSTLSMRSLAYHEAVPGHHFQLAIQQELTGLPKFRSKLIFGGGSAHSEGWALYTERLAIEQGWYEGDVPSLLGALDAQLFRARRLVVDTGLHAKGWTRQQAIDYGIAASEVERYVAEPGQACSYMIGMLRILELREKARSALGGKFTLPAFHDVVLQTGSVPLDVLAEVIDQWIAAQR
jgi:uncharacterized protein (DUF885 family)